MTESSVQVNFLLRINMVFDAIDIKQPVLLRRLTLHAAEGLLTGKRLWIFRLARVDPVPDR